MSLSLFVRRLRLRHLNQFNTPFSSSIHRLLSTTTTTNVAPLPNPHFPIEYLIQSCGLPSDEAIRASKKIHHLNTPHKPDAVLHFLRQTGISESHITTSVSRDPRILCSSVDNIWRPNVAKLQEVGICMEDISCIISYSPGVFKFNFVPKIDFWVRLLGSVDNLSLVLKRHAAVLHSSLEKVIVPNLSYLQEQCGLPLCRIVQLIKFRPRFITSRTEALKMIIKRAEELGVAPSSQMFVYALVVVGSMNKDIIDTRLNNLKNLGFSQEEVTTLVRKHPMILNITEENIGSKIQFLIMDAVCDKLHVVRNPILLTLSLEKRLIPRSLVLKVLESKGLEAPKRGLVSIAKLNEKQFLEKMVLPYEHTIPGLHRAYTDAVSGNTSAMEWLKNISN